MMSSMRRDIISLVISPGVLTAIPSAMDSPPDVALTLASSVISVGDLIAHAVTAQINELDQESQQRLERYYLSEGEVQQQAEAGVVALKKIDPVREIGRARRAFVRRAFVVVANGRHLDSLDDELPLTDATL